ncbi:putative ABC transporter permease YknZ [Stieleria neptunia]|uniref:Putative ABC transporter permease YknZ n=1 Tax=Stieleria neptunia TaxID=2527979 RepID=A0A518HZ36_9BACT|nr:ABC transporter permease [Stieleria neptunia]QDV46110.1 putative ABC transporter permease YknZ [Stieleria neptunia]
MRFSALILKNLTRRPLRAALTLIALTMAVASVVALRGIAKGFTESFADIYESHSIDIVVSRQGTADRLSSSVSEAAIVQIEQLGGVAKAAGVLLDTLSLEDQQIFGVPTMGIAADSWLRDDFRWRERRSGAKAGSTDTPPKQLSLGIHLAERAGISVGQNVMIFEEPYVVDGIFESSSVWENGSMVMPLDQLQAISDRNGQVTYINVLLDRAVDRGDARSIVDQIHGIDSRLHAMTTDEFVGTDTRMQLAAAMAWMTSIIALAIGAIGTLNTMMTSVLERTREIGVLRAVGWPRRRVIGMIVSESIMLALLASFFGGGLAILATDAMSRHPAVRGVLVPAIDAATLLEGTVLAVFIGLLGALLPAKRAASVMPTEALRNS